MPLISHEIPKALFDRHDEVSDYPYVLGHLLSLDTEYADFYKALPEDKIKRTFAVELGKNFKISARRVDEFLKRKDMFKKIEHGSYIKV